MLIRMLPLLIFCLFIHMQLACEALAQEAMNRMSQDNVSIIIADLGYGYIWLYALLCCNLKLIQLYDTSSVFNIEYNWNDLVSNDSMLLYEHNHTGRFMNFIFGWVMITPSSPSH